MKGSLMTDLELVNKRPWGLSLAATYAGFLGVAIIVGFLASIGYDGRYPGNAVNMPIISTLIALTLLGTAFGLFKQNNYARLAFFIIVPWGSLALASAFARTFWHDDIPYTHFLFLIYAPLVFLLSRKSVLDAVGSNQKWLYRGGAILLLSVLIMTATWYIILATKPSGGQSFYGQLVTMNDYVKRKVICYVPMWSYVYGFLAVSLPLSMPNFLKNIFKQSAKHIELKEKNDVEVNLENNNDKKPEN